MKKVVLVLLVVLAGLYFTNPKMDQFQSFVLEQLEHKLEENGSANSKMEALLQKNLVSVAAGVAKNLTVRKEYYVCSLYSLDIGTENFSYLGIGTIFIPLQAEQPTDWLE